MQADPPAHDHDHDDDHDHSQCGGAAPYVRDAPKVGRNDPCPCGSGRKSKKCCAA